jgi:8-oxo-dGTP pyrophosphatase MutT (NUDIX family)
MGADIIPGIMDSVVRNDVILAAGAIVCRETDAGPQVALVHRRRYGDWTLPKGKLNPGESFSEAATREVYEETGCNGALGEYVGAIGYEVGEKPKAVLFWRMSPSDQNAAIDQEEVIETRWMNFADAINQLSHGQERELLRKLAGTHARPYQGLEDLPLKRRGRKWSWSRGERAYARLLREFEAFRVELAFAEQRGARKEIAWADAAKDQLRNVERYLSTRDIEGGWYCLHAARRLALFGLNDEEIKIRAQALREETQKLSSWRAQAISGLLDDAQGE